MITRLANILRTIFGGRLPTAPLQRRSKSCRLSGSRIGALEDRLKVKFAVDPAADRSWCDDAGADAGRERAQAGIANLPGGGDVLIRASVSNDTLTVKIENAGSRRPLPERRSSVLNNARERLRILYGDQASLNLANCDGDRWRRRC